MGKLDGKVALLTGSSPNIVGGIAEGLADEGAKIVSVDIFQASRTAAPRPSTSVVERPSAWSVM